MSEENVKQLLEEEIDESKFATKSSPVAIILCTFLGFLGAHRFYTGYYFIGLFQMFTCGGFLVWFLIDMIQLFRNRFQDSKGNSLMNYNENNKLASGLCCIATILAISWGCLWLNQLDSLRIKLINPNSKNIINTILKSRNPDYLDKITEEQEQATPEQIKKIDYKISTKSGINIVDDYYCENEHGDKLICGTVANITRDDIKNVVIKIELYDKNKIWTSCF